jgi:protocatechuate 3,4-dioxygenase beta subunit
VWQTLERLPEIYRIPLILYYRERRSVSRVAEALGLSTGAVKQRLHRGRLMLKQEVMSLVEDSLERTRTRRNFTSKILAALPASSATLVQDSVSTSAPALANASTVSPFGTAKIIGAAIGVLLIGAVAFIGVRNASEADSTLELNQIAYSPPDDVVLSAEPARVLARDMTVNSIELAKSEAAHGPVPLETAQPGYPGHAYPDPPEQTIVGHVYEPNGAPAKGAKVWLARFAMNARDTRETVTDDTGSFTLTAPPGQWTLCARKDLFSGEADTAFAGQLITVESGPIVETEIHVTERGRVYGRILDRMTGAPIPFGALWTSDRFLVRSDAEGRYEIEGQQPGYHTLTALCAGYERRYVIYSPVLVRETELDIFLDRGGKVRGQVVDPTGRPMAHAWVYRPMSGYGSLSANYEVCDNEGRFEFDGLPLGQTLELAARIPYFLNVCGHSVPAADETETRSDEFILTHDQPSKSIIMTLEPAEHPEVRAIQTWDDSKVAGIVTGRVVDPAGRPVRNFCVLTQLPHTDGGDGGFEINDFGIGFSFTSDDGYFAMTRPEWKPGAKVRLVAVADGFGQASPEQVTIRPPSNVGSRQPDVLLPLSPAGRLSVRVMRRGTPSTPLAGARVTLRDAHPGGAGVFDWQDAHNRAYRPVSEYTDDRGWAQFENLSLNAGMVLVEKEGCGRERMDWNLREERTSITLAHNEAVVEGHVLDANDEPLSTGSVSLRWANSESSYDLSSRDHNRIYVKFTDTHPGHFRVDQLPPGEYVLKISWLDRQNGEHAYSDEFTLNAGDVMTVTYPDDAISENPDRWLARSDENAEDQTLRKAIVGTWTRDGLTAKGAGVRTTVRFTEAGGFERWILAKDTALHDKGLFKVDAGTLRITTDAGGLITYTVVELLNSDTLSLGRIGLPPEDPLHRTDP